MDRESIIQGIYEAAALPERWPEVLEHLGRTAGTPGIVLLTRRSDSWTGYAVSKPLEEAFLGYLQTDIPPRSDTTRRLLAADRAGFLSDGDLYPGDEWEREPFRNEWGRAWGWNHAAATAIDVPSGDFLVFHAQRQESLPAFSARDIAVLDSFRPHLARSGLLAVRWRLQRLRAAAEALALIGLPAAIVDRDGQVLAANALIQELTPYLRWLPKDRVALVDAQANGLLRQALAGLFDPHGDAVRSFAARSTTGGAAIVHVIPTAGQARDIFDGGLAVLILTPVASSNAPDATVIRGLFDLSPSEARVARALTRGDTIEKIARDAGVARETVRSQVKAILSKTGTSRQAEMTALLAGLPRLKP